MPDGKTVAQKMRENLAALRAAQAPRERIQEELMYWQGKMNEQSAADPERQRGVLDTVEGLGQAAGDAATFGALGLLDDALSTGFSADPKAQERFRIARDLRKERRAETTEAHPTAMLASQLTGALLNPVGRVLGPVKAGAGVLRTVGKAALEGASQAGLQTVGENAGTSDNPYGTNDLGSMMTGAAVLGGGIGAVGKAIPVVRTIRKAMKASDLDETAIRLRDAIKEHDAIAYGKVNAEARATPTTPALEQAYNDPSLESLRNIVDKSRKYRDASTATKAQIMYRLLSRIEGKLGKQIEGSPDFLADVGLKLEDIPILKSTLLKGATRRSTSVIPGKPAVIEQGPLRKLYQSEYVLPETPAPATAAASTPLKTAAELRAARRAQTASERGDAWAARETNEAVRQGEGMSTNWETQAQSAQRKAMDRADVERELQNTQAPAVDPDASPYLNPATGRPENLFGSLREALQAFRAGLGGQAAREGRGAAEAPWYTQRAYPKGKDDFARRFEQTFASETPPNAPKPPEAGEWVTRQTGAVPTEGRIVEPAVPRRVVEHGPAMPSWPKAIEGHRVLKKEEQAFRRAADMADRVMYGADLKGDKLLKHSKKIWKEEIRQMTPSEAREALKGALGRLREGPDRTRVPLGRTGAILSATQQAMSPARLRPFIELLEQQAGIAAKPNRVAEKGAGLVGRLSAIWGNE